STHPPPSACTRAGLSPRRRRRPSRRTRSAARTRSMATAVSRATQPGRIRRVVSTRLPTRWGVFQAHGFERDVTEGSPRVETALALVLGDPAAAPPLVRIHSQCFTGEMLGSLRCDCSGHADLAMRAIAGEGRGVLIYEHQEGRGIGLMAKLRAYAL